MSYALLHQKTLPESIYLAIGRIDYSSREKHLLAEEELAKYESIKSEARKKEFIRTRQFVKELSAQIGYHDSDFCIRKDKLGKPYGIANDKRIYLSLAHSSEYIICGLSETKDLGVDLEPVDRKIDNRLRRRMLHPEEQAEVREMNLLQLWTIKEALVKLEGGGLRTNLNDLVVTRINETEFSGRFSNDKTARICSFQHHRHWIAVAYFS